MKHRTNALISGFFLALLPLLLAITPARADATRDTQSNHAPPNDAPRIVNIVNFIRGVEPREPVDLVEPVRQQIRLARRHGLPTTFLIQYDALIQPAFTDMLREELTEHDEIGVWLEVVQPQVEAAGLEWKGRFPWDWHTDVGFTIGYTPAQRQKLMDVLMHKFREVFGRLPASVGCWVIDAPTLNYLADAYGITAACICKDQMGTDGYNLWGGYWNQAYYPSRLNAFMPAQTDAQQLDVPVFRMLGSDPIHQYDTGLGHARQGVISLEPVYPESGGNPDWVRWFFDVNFNAPCLAFAYAQAGQENSFGWPAMSRGLEDQYALMAREAKARNIRVETLARSAEWFRKSFDRTPATAVTALTDWRPENRRSVWYESRNYRINLCWEANTFRVRDIHRFDENYAERYLHERVTTNDCVYDTLPVVDGYAWSSREGDLAGLRVVRMNPDGSTTPLTCGQPTVTQEGEGTDADALLVTIPLTAGGEVRIRCSPSKISISVEDAFAPEGWALRLAWDATKPTGITEAKDDHISYNHNGYSYDLNIRGATAAMGEDSHSVLITPNSAFIDLVF